MSLIQWFECSDEFQVMGYVGRLTIPDQTGSVHYLVVKYPSSGQVIGIEPCSEDVSLKKMIRIGWKIIDHELYGDIDDGAFE